MGLGFRVEGLGSRTEGSGFRVSMGFAATVWGLGCCVWFEPSIGPYMSNGPKSQYPLYIVFPSITPLYDQELRLQLI